MWREILPKKMWRWGKKQMRRCSSQTSWRKWKLKTQREARTHQWKGEQFKDGQILVQTRTRSSWNTLTTVEVQYGSPTLATSLAVSDKVRLSLPYELASDGRHDEVTQTVAYTGEISYLTVLKAGSLGSRCQLRGRLCPPPLPQPRAVRWPSAVFLGLWANRPDLWRSPCLHVCAQFPSFIRTQTYWIKTHPPTSCQPDHLQVLSK